MTNTNIVIGSREQSSVSMAIILNASMPCPLTSEVKLTYARTFHCEDWGDGPEWQDPLADQADAQDQDLSRPKPW